ncbi:MAG: hypothetical protein KAH32_07845 [Chlamydiia bacterium]|nr:hypothetical protein [Chlamydiia bacterium]
MANFLTAFPIEEALKSLRADQLNAAVIVGDKLTIKTVTIHASNTHEELQEVPTDGKHYFRVTGEINSNGKVKRVQVPLASIFGAIVMTGTTAVPMIDSLVPADGTKTIDLSAIINRTVQALITIPETNAQVIEKLGESIKRQSFKNDGTPDEDVYARFAMTDHKEYATLKADADKKNLRVNYVVSALTGVSSKAIPLRQLVFTA